MSPVTIVDAGQIAAIAEEVFAAMVDGEPGHLLVWPGGDFTIDSPLHAWVDIHASFSGRVQLSTNSATADDLARALLGMDDTEPVSEADLVDAFGEVANVVGGNLKALLPEQGRLTMPEVNRVPPSTDNAVELDEVVLSWRGRPLVITIWKI